MTTVTSDVPTWDLAQPDRAVGSRGLPPGRARAPQWELGDLYSGPDDPRLEQDLTAPVAAAEAWAARYRGRVAELDGAGLAAAVVEQEALAEPLYRASAYASLRFATDTHDAQRRALTGRAQQQAAAVRSHLLFFDLEWLAVDEARAAALLADPALAAYRHHLEGERRYAPHTLSEPEEQVLTKLSPTGPAAWQRLFTTLTSGITVDLPDGRTTLTEALSLLHHAGRDTRDQAADAVSAALEQDLDVRGQVFDTLLHDKALRDDLRSYEHWIAGRNLANDASDEQVQALIDAVTGRYDVVARWYRLKGRLLGVTDLGDHDRYAPLPGSPEQDVTWDQGRDLVLAAYTDFSPRMATIAEEYFDRGWIDGALGPAKRNGAFCAPTVPALHPYVFVNWTGTARDVMTVAHELGHGVHMRLSQEQTLFNTSTPLTTAETASILGEEVTFRRLAAQAGDDGARLALLAGRIDEAIATIFRQVAMNRFEDAVHTARRADGELSADRLSELWMATQQPMFGDALTLQPRYRSWWSYVPHFVSTPGYVYAYAFGNLLSFALLACWEADPEAFVPEYLAMLARGGSASPQDLVAPLGVDLSDPGFWDAGLDVFAGLVDDAEELAASLEP